MPGQSVSLTQTIDDRDVLQAFQRQNRALRQMEKRLSAVGRQGRQAGRQSNQQFERARRTLGQFATAVAGVGSVVGGIAVAAAQLRREFENIKQRQQEAAQTQITVARAQRQAIRNLPTEVSPKRLNQVVENIARQTGADRAALFQAAGGALSFKARTQSPEQAFQAVQAAARLAPGNVQEINAVARGILAQQASQGGRVKSVAAFQELARKQTPISEGEQFARNFAPALSNLASFGDSAQEAAALLATIGQRAKDPEGRVTRTAAIRLAQQLKEALPQLSSTLERIRFIQSPRGAKLRSELLGSLEERLPGAGEARGPGGKGSLSVEAKTFTAAVSLLQSRDNEVRELLRENLAAIKPVAQLSGQFDRLVKQLNQQSLQGTRALSLLAKSTQQELELSNLVGARGGITRKATKELLQAAGLSATGQALAQLGFEADTRFGQRQPVGRFQRFLRQRAERRLRTRETRMVPAGTGGADVEVQVPREVTERDREVAATFNRLSDAIEQFVQQSRENARATEENTRAQRETRGGSPVRSLSREDR